MQPAFRTYKSVIKPVLILTALLLVCTGCVSRSPQNVQSSNGTESTDSDNIDLLITQLNSTDIAVATKASDELAAYSYDERVIPAFISALDHPDIAVAGYMSVQLAQFGEDAVPYLVEVLQEANSRQSQYYAISAFIGMDQPHPEATQYVIPFLDPDDEDIRKICLEYLVRWGDNGINVADKVVPMILSPDNSIRTSACRAAAKCNYREDATWAALSQNLQIYNETGDRASCLRAMAYLAPVPDDILAQITNLRPELTDKPSVWASCAIFLTDNSRTGDLEYLISLVTTRTELGTFMSMVEALSIIGPSAGNSLPALERMLNRIDLSPSNLEKLREAINVIGENEATD